MKQICKLVVMLLLTFTAGVQAQLVTYPESLNPGIPHNDDYTVHVYVSPAVSGKTCLNTTYR